MQVQQEKTTKEKTIFLDKGKYIDLHHQILVENDFIISLSGTETRILECLIHKLGHPVSTNEIKKYSWRNSEYTSKQDIYVYISRIRRKIEKNPNSPKHLLAIHGYGYLLHSEFV